MKSVYLKPNKEVSVKRYHPWIYSGAIHDFKNLNIDDGELVKVFDNKNNFLGIGFFSKSPIAVKLISLEETEINKSFWIKKLKRAIDYRKRLNLFDLSHSNAFRLIYGESDEIPGLIIDYYNGVLVVQCHNLFVYKNLHNIIEALIETLPLPIKAIYNKSKNTVPIKYKNEINDSFIFGNYNKYVEILENNNKFIVDIVDGQKTGFYLDQKENRLLFSRYVKNKNILNLFSYTGSFSIYAEILGESKSCINVDCSAKALEIAELNSKLNNCNNIKNIKSRVDKFLKNLNEKFDVIILDPPAFAKNIKEKKDALKGYCRINKLTLDACKNGSIVFSFSCTQVISLEEFKQAIFIAATRAKKNIKILHTLTQSPDHPISIYCPETNYLKGLVLYVSDM